MNTKAAIERLERQIIDLLHMDHFELEMYQNDHARDYLEMWSYRTPFSQEDEAEQDIDLMLELQEFKSWWRQLWANRDRDFRSKHSRVDLFPYYHHESAVKYWRTFHNAREILDQFTPPATVMAAFKKEKKDQENAFLTLSSLTIK